MAGCRAELLAVLTGTLLLLLLGSVRGWERINKTQLLSLYKTGHWNKVFNSLPPDVWVEPSGAVVQADDKFNDGGDDDDDDYDDDLNETIIGTRLITSNSGRKPDSEQAEEDPGIQTWPGLSESDFQIEFENPFLSQPGYVAPDSGKINVICRKDGFHITLIEGLMSSVSVLGSNELLHVVKAPESCNYAMNPAANTLFVPFTGCHVTKNTNDYSLQLLFDSSGETQITSVSCGLDSGLVPSEGAEPRCCKPDGEQTTPPPKAQNCDIPLGERLPCGHSGISHSECDKRGCCMYMDTCYYPIDECTLDQHFVFAIRASTSVIPVKPTQLVIPGHPNCRPVIVNNHFAIFKFKVDECGTRAYEVGEMRIYLVEVQTIVKALNLKYGIITRSDPLRFLIECRYSKCGTSKQSLASVGYMVKTPTSSLPSSILSDGLYGVQLRIARDHTYSSYFPTYHQPLKLLLGKPVFLELVLKSPNPDAVLLVNYCLAYPRSAKNALVLIFEGCANPNDPHVSVLKVSDSSKRFQKRFTVHAFQFMEKRTNDYLNEEIYFMCSTEVCLPSEKTCEERCFDGKVSHKL